VKIAILGLGFMGTTHLKALDAIEGVQLAAVLGNDERQLAGDFSAVKGNLGGPAGKVDLSGVAKYRHLDALLADRSIDAVDICLPTDLHEPVAIQALRAGKHVLVEKPMALTGAAADRMVAEAERCGRLLMTAHVLRFWPEFAALREAVRGGRFGCARYGVFHRRCAAPGWGGWLKDPARSGGGVFDLLIHDVDMCLHLFGTPEAVSATGHSDAAAGIDCIHAELFYSVGAAVLITGGWHAPGAFPFSMEFTVAFDGGTLDYSSAGRPLVAYTAGGAECLANGAGGDGYAAEIAYFAECCRSGRPPDLCPPRESAAAVELMLRILEARNRNGEKLTCNL
jgi:predicted dehydrogenase